MNSYMVLYRDSAVMCDSDPPFGFHCMAEDSDHAEEQCVDAYPDCDVVWVVESLGTADDYQYALNDYYFMAGD